MYINKLNPVKIKNLYWGKEYNIEEIANKLNISIWSLCNFMNKHNISRRNRSEASYISNRLRPQFEISANLSAAQEKLKIAGVMLYWAEGTLKGNTVDFTNSNPQMTKVFLRFLREICGAKEERLRVYLYAYSYHNLKRLKAYWREVTQIPLPQFTKPYIRKGNPNLSNRKLPYGLVHIRYNDKRLLQLIKNWIDEYMDWAGTQVAKGGRLYKKQRLAER